MEGHAKYCKEATLRVSAAYHTCMFAQGMRMQFCTDETRPSEADFSLDLSTKRMIASTGTRSLAWSSRTVEGKGLSPSVTCSLCSVPRLERVRGL